MFLYGMMDSGNIYIYIYTHMHTLYIVVAWWHICKLCEIKSHIMLVNCHVLMVKSSKLCCLNMLKSGFLVVKYSLVLNQLKDVKS